MKVEEILSMSKPVRRRMSGKPLLVAGAGATLLVSSCVAVSGNLVAPPMVELCVDVTPEEAEPAIQFNANLLPEDTDCMDVFEGTVRIQATAAGYEDYDEDIEVYEDTTHEIVLTESE